VLDETNEIVKDLLGKLTISPNDRNEEIHKLIFQQKRAMLQRFINHEENQGIRVNNLQDIELNFIIKSLKR
jgi:23S rRNA maturation-related 3'-5' exoribonuclease YhaM